MPDVFRQKFGELTGIDCGFVMLGAILLCGQASIRALVRRLWIGKANGVTADGMRCLTRSQPEHCGGVHAAAQEKTDRNVAYHVERDGFFEKMGETRLRLAKGRRRRLEMKVPILPLVGFTGTK